MLVYEICVLSLCFFPYNFIIFYLFVFCKYADNTGFFTPLAETSQLMANGASVTK